MKFKVLDPVVVEVDLPEAGISKGAVGTVVEVYETGGLEVEVLDAQGATIGVVTVLEGQVRPASGTRTSGKPKRQ